MQKFFGALTLCIAISTLGQGTFQFDQESSTNQVPPGYGSQLYGLQPTGQSFTPSLSGINFVRLMFDDGADGDGHGASVYLNLRSQSLNGPILGATPLVNMPDGFHGAQDFFFPNTIAITPGTTYCFELVVPSAFNWLTDVGPFNYPGGTAFANGFAWAAADYWFREGSYTIPEPSGFMLALVGLGVVGLRRVRR